MSFNPRAHQTFEDNMKRWRRKWNDVVGALSKKNLFISWTFIHISHSKTNDYKQQFMLDLRWLNIISPKIDFIWKSMFQSRFVLVSVFFVVAGAVTDNARDLQRILNTQSIRHFRYFNNRANPSVPTRE